MTRSAGTRVSRSAGTRVSRSAGASASAVNGARASEFAGLHVLVDDDPRWGRDPVAQAEAVCPGAPAVIQLRAKYASDECVLEWAQRIRALAHACGARFVVNDRFDIAWAAGADAVHLGQSDLPPARVPASLREKLAIGRSTHDDAQLRAAAAEPVDYLAFGPVFGTQSKRSEYDARGLDALADAVAAAAPRPLVAIGGIDEGNIERVAETGAAGAAVISAVAGAPDPAAAVRRLAAAFAGGAR